MKCFPLALQHKDTELLASSAQNEDAWLTISKMSSCSVQPQDWALPENETETKLEKIDLLLKVRPTQVGQEPFYSAVQQHPSKALHQISWQLPCANLPTWAWCLFLLSWQTRPNSRKLKSCTDDSHQSTMLIHHLWSDKSSYQEIPVPPSYDMESFLSPSFSKSLGALKERLLLLLDLVLL